MSDTPKTFQLNFDGYWPEPIISGLPAASGIYCVFSCTHNSQDNTVALKKLLYIGESADVRGRVDGHPGWDTWKRALTSGQVICLSAATISPEADRERAEAAMIFKHQPPSNTSLKDSFAQDTTTIKSSGKTNLLTSSFTVSKGATR